MPERLQLLRYEYVEDMAERRGPHRDAHLALIDRYAADGRIAVAGAAGDPPSTGLIAFREAVDAQAFRDEDPYVEAGLVTRWSVEPWTVVTPLP
jgi:uncharacterized protein YciI